MKLKIIYEQEVEKIRKRLLDRRIIIRTLCKRSGVSYQTVYNFINKDSRPSVVTLEKILIALNEMEKEWTK